MDQTRRHLLAATLLTAAPWSASASPSVTTAVPAAMTKPVAFLTPEEFGALGDGKDDTQALQKVLATGRHVYLAGSYTFQDATLDLRTPGQRLYGPGNLIQKCVALNRAPANPDANYPPSRQPAVKLSAVECLVQIGSITAAWEAIEISADNCSVLHTICKGNNETWYDGILCYANNPSIVGNTIEGFGQWPAQKRYAVRGDGIFLSSGPSGANRGGIVALNHVKKCAKNALFVIGQQGWVAQGNILEACAMSSIQLAFLKNLQGGNVSNFAITGNIGRYCGADSVDINNSSGSANEALFGSISGNSFDSNGWLFGTPEQQQTRQGKGAATADGAGYTLISVSDLRSTGNYFYNTARAVAYLASVQRIMLDDEGHKISSSALDDTDGIRLSEVKSSDIKINLTVPGNIYRAEGDNSGTVVHDCNWRAINQGVVAVTTPNNTVCPLYKHNSVQIHSGIFISNGLHPLNGCTFLAQHHASARFFGKVEISSTHFKGASLNIEILDPRELTIRDVKIEGAAEGPILRIKNSINGNFRDVYVKNNSSGPAITFHGTARVGENHLQNVVAKNSSDTTGLHIEKEIPTGVIYYVDTTSSTPSNEKSRGATIKRQAWI